MNQLIATIVACCIALPALAVAEDRGASNLRSYAEVLSSRPMYSPEQRLESYDVIYRYNGRTYNTRLPYDPGESLPVRKRGSGAALRLQ